MKRPRKRDVTHSPACAVQRGAADCTCEASLIEHWVQVRCVCGNVRREVGIREYSVEECRCVSPGDGPRWTDDSVDRYSREHVYNVDRL